LNVTEKEKANGGIKFAVGYQLPDETGASFVDMVRDYREHVAEVYFAWMGSPSCRGALGVVRGETDWTAQAQMEKDLRALGEMGVKLDLLFNANCYGGRAVSRHLESEVRGIISHIENVAGGVDIVTTTSLAIARTVKKYFPNIDVRASVNMRIGTIQGMAYSSEYFDSYHVQRDVQRDLDKVRKLKAWSDEHGKRLYMLANSGCLRFCPGQIFHDNMVAHDAEIDETVNISDWTPHVCWNLYRSRENWPAVLQATWVRPEDLHHYEGIFPVVKLATRMHVKPLMVLHAYANRRYAGNLLDLFEPGHGPVFAPYIIDNTRFPSDWFDHGAACTLDGGACRYCSEVLDKVLVKTT
jgi:hypothetical protein